MIRAYNRREKTRVDEKKQDLEYAVTVAYRAAVVAGTAALAGFSKKIKLPPMDEVFREWYQSKEQNAEPWEHQKAGFSAYADAYNAALRKKKRGGPHG